MHWLVAQTKHRQEGRAVQRLEQQGFRVYCPKIPKYGRLGEAVGNQVLFPGYCFVEDHGMSIISIKSTPGVIGLIVFGHEGKPAKLSDSELEAIRAAEAFHREKVLGIKHGDTISVIDGPFKGFKGLYSKRSKDRVEVLLVLLGQEQRIQIRSNQIRADHVD
jgi:transcriptional antiterminator RfaH